jgi:hypothetical protein
MDTELNLVPQADGSKPISRRRALKRLGVAAGAVWAAPLFVTTGTAAAHTGSVACLEGGYPDAPACTPCPACRTLCGGTSTKPCCCFIDVKGCCFCGANVSCDQIPACKKNADCPAGWRCTYTCCPNTPKGCTPPCGTGQAVAAAEKTAGGKHS